jgi:hypothetical protein
MNNDITLNPIVIVSLTKEQIGLIIKSLSFTRSNFKLNPSFHYQSSIRFDKKDKSMIRNIQILNNFTKKQAIGNMTKQEAQELFDYLKKENIVDCECIQEIKEVLKDE